jgi:hypothetical protein
VCCHTPGGGGGKALSLLVSLLLLLLLPRTSKSQQGATRWCRCCSQDRLSPQHSLKVSVWARAYSVGNAPTNLGVPPLVSACVTCSAVVVLLSHALAINMFRYELPPQVHVRCVTSPSGVRCTPGVCACWGGLSCGAGSHSWGTLRGYRLTD